MRERTQFDYIVVGGGTAGCIVASRLSADPALQVALIEAGEDTPPDHADEVIWDSYPIIAYFDPRHHWRQLRVFYGDAPEGDDDTPGIFRYEQAKVMGGGSSINGMMANRGAPADYDGWAAQGADGWSWEHVLPYFCQLEHDLDFDTDQHGVDGPISIRRVPESDWPEFSRAAARALARAGFQRLDDQNTATFEPGYFPITINNAGDRRVSTAAGYLTSEVRARPNLTILAETEVLRLTTEGPRVTGVEVRSAGRAEPVALQAGEVVICAGAIHTPALLLRSGIGPAAELATLGIDSVADVPGVGANLQEHPQIAVTALLQPDARQPWEQRRHIFAGFRYSSGIEGCDPLDMYGVVVNRGAWHSLGQKLGGFLIWVNRAYSKGKVSLVSADPAAEPRVEFAFLSDERDLLRLTDGLKRLATLFADPDLQATTVYPFATSYTEKSRDLAVPSPENESLVATVAERLDDAAADIRSVMISEVASGPDLFALVQDDVALTEFVRTRAHGTWHCCGTCRMGRADDPMAVTDPAGRVYGVEGLRIGDASLMPAVPRANTNIPVMMIGEKIAAAVLEERG
ncbi:MAG TPA: FAD-dependent oxidoreductase [Thermomicrobiales bacterium]|nr:FAD-dependent oxidoreductase [Thermomicrobiales bacterium]